MDFSTFQIPIIGQEKISVYTEYLDINIVLVLKGEMGIWNTIGLFYNNFLTTEHYCNLLKNDSKQAFDKLSLEKSGNCLKSEY